MERYHLHWERADPVWGLLPGVADLFQVRRLGGFEATSRHEEGVDGLAGGCRDPHVVHAQDLTRPGVPARSLRDRTFCVLT